MSPCLRIANEKLAAPNTETVGTVIINAASVISIEVLKDMHIKNKILPINACTIVHISIFISCTLPARRAGNDPLNAINAPMPPNIALYICGDTPYIF